MTTPGGSWAGGWDEPGVLSFVLIGAGTPGGGLFVYNTATPQKGSLIAAIVPVTTTDVAGNVTSPVLTIGQWSAITGQVMQHITIDSAGTMGLANASANTTLFFESDKSMFAVYTSAGRAAGNLVVSTTNNAGDDGVTNTTLAGVASYTQLASGVTLAVALSNGQIKYFRSPTGPAGTFTAVGNGPIDQTDTQFLSNPNNAGTTDLSKQWGIFANDPQVGTIYEIEVPFDGTFEGNTLTLGASLNGNAVAGPPQGAQLAAGFLGAGAAFTGWITVRLQIQATGSSGSANIWVKGGAAAATALTGGAGDTILNGRQITTAFNTTVDNLLTVASLWGASNASQTVTGFGSKFTRSGP